jgi:hypothetical protein
VRNVLVVLIAGALLAYGLLRLVVGLGLLGQRLGLVEIAVWMSRSGTSPRFSKPDKATRSYRCPLPAMSATSH